MRYINGLLKKNLAKWKGKQWYHQRFDGSPFSMWLVSEGEISSEERKKGTNFTVHFSFFENDRCDWYILEEDNKRITSIMVSLGKENVNISAKMLAEWKEDEERFFEKCREIEGLDLSNLTDEELIKLHDNLKQLTIKRHSSSSTIDGFALGSDQLIANKIRKIAEQTDMKFTEVFTILTAPVHLSFVNEADLSLMRVIKGEKSIEEHQKQYFWLNNNYVDQYVLDVDYFEKEISRIKSMKIDVDEQIRKFENFPSEHKRKKEELMSKLEIDDELKALIKISEDFTHWQDERKRSTLWVTHYFELIFEEIGKRVGLSAHQMKYLTPTEVSNVFVDKISALELDARVKRSVFYMDENGTEALSGDEAAFVKKELLSEVSHEANDFRGLTASLGKAIGKVKIVRSAKEISKVLDGDILVAVMTRPDYVPAMKRAAAIVTDEGGVTSHAAIVSREIGVPCIIGTKIATKVLKDGMMVEVNANHGWVKIIKE